MKLGAMFVPLWKLSHPDMSELVIHHHHGKLSLPLPYYIYINGQLVGFVRGREVRGTVPPGRYAVGVKVPLLPGKWEFSLSSSAEVSVAEGESVTLTFSTRERWWDLLFNLDLACWLLSLFFTIPHPWNIVYHVLSEGFFAVWLIRLWRIRRNYFKVAISFSPQKK